MASQIQISQNSDPGTTGTKAGTKDAKQTIWPFLVLSFFGLILVNAIWLFPTLRDVRDNTSRLRLEVAERAAEGVGGFMEKKIEALRNTASAMRFEKEGSLELIERLLKENPEFNSLSVIDQGLKEILKVSRFQVVKKEDLADFSASEELKKVFAGEVYQGPVLRNQTLEPLTTVAVPLVFGEGEKSALLGELNLKFLSGLVGRFKFGSTGKVYLIDNTANIIIHPDISLVLKGSNLRYSGDVLEVLKGATTPTFTHFDEKGIGVEASGLFLPAFGWGVISEQNLSEINILRNRIILVAALSFSIGALLLLFIFQNRLKLVQLNQKLSQYLYENYLSAQLLVRRDLELTEANTRLQELDEAKSEFVSVAAHQLRTPLTGIRWSYQVLLEDGKLNKEQRKTVEDALQAAIRMTNLINDLLNVARIEEGRFGFMPRPSSLESFFSLAIPRFSKQAEEKGVKFIFDTSKEQLVANFDPEKTSVVLEDLLDNAIKYTPSGGKVSVRILPLGKFVRIEIEDTGIGIPKDQQRLVFSKFFRADNALLFQTAGTGLGLYLVKNIIEKQGGDIGFKSEEGKGSTFWFTLPMVK